MTRISSRSIKVAENIRDRIPFRTHGALRAEYAHGYIDRGHLNNDERAILAADRDLITYVVYSYGTPIAWFVPMKGWHKVNQKFSRTTSCHQGKLYLV